MDIDPRYKRVLNTSKLTLLGLSMTIGSGIFVLIDDVAKHGKNFMWLGMLLAGVMCILTGLGYGELSSIFNNNLGEYGYIKSVTNETFGSLVGYILLLSDVFIIATVSLGLGNYVSKLVNINSIDLINKSTSPTIIAIIAIIALNIINYLGIQVSTSASNVALFVKIVLLIMIIVISINGNTRQENPLDITQFDINGISTASIIALFAYLGFNNLTNFAEETVNPEKSIGQSITNTLIIVTILYTLLLISSQFIVSSSDLSHSNTPLATITGKIFGSYGFVFCIILGIISLLDTILVSSMSESRYIHAFLSRKSDTYKELDMDHTTKTPYISIIVLSLLAIVIIIIFGNISNTAIFGDLIILSVFIMINIVVIALRIKQPELDRKFKVPFNINNIPIPSILGIIFGLYAIYYYVKHIFS